MLNSSGRRGSHGPGAWRIWGSAVEPPSKLPSKMLHSGDWGTLVLSLSGLGHKLVLARRAYLWQYSFPLGSGVRPTQLGDRRVQAFRKQGPRAGGGCPSSLHTLGFTQVTCSQLQAGPGDTSLKEVPWDSRTGSRFSPRALAEPRSSSRSFLGGVGVV